MLYVIYAPLYYIRYIQAIYLTDLRRLHNQFTTMTELLWSADSLSRVIAVLPLHQYYAEAQTWRRANKSHLGKICPCPFAPWVGGRIGEPFDVSTPHQSNQNNFPQSHFP
jgi:hypothetical protein